jgi:hypothetical protein
MGWFPRPGEETLETSADYADGTKHPVPSSGKTKSVNLASEVKKRPSFPRRWESSSTLQRMIILTIKK